MQQCVGRAVEFYPPDDVISVPQKILLLPLGHIVDHTYSSHKIHHFPRGCVEQIVPALVASVAVHPLQPELALRSCFVGHAFDQDRQIRTPAPTDTYTSGLRETCTCTTGQQTHLYSSSHSHRSQLLGGTDSHMYSYMHS